MGGDRGKDVSNQEYGAGSVGDPREVAVSPSDIAAYRAGVADRSTALRVVAAALFNPGVRARVARVREEAGGYAADLPDTTDDAAAAAPRLDTLRRAMGQAAQSVAEENEGLEALRAAHAARGGGIWRIAAEAWAGLRRATDHASRSLATGMQSLSLPCLAPAAADPGASLELRRETVTTPEGVRIEFQQLPSVTPSRLRLLVDASVLAGVDPDTPPYDAAFVVLEEASGSGTDRHILVVALNEQGRGFTDFVTGHNGDAAAASGPAAASVLPSPRGVYRLTGATLTRFPEP